MNGFSVKDGKIYRGVRNFLETGFGKAGERRLWWRAIATCSCAFCSWGEMESPDWRDGYYDGWYDGEYMKQLPVQCPM